MGIFSNLRKRIFKDKPSKYETEEGRPKTIIATGAKGMGGGITSQDRSEKSLKTYWNYYNGEGTIFASINTTAWNSVMVGYSLISENENAKEAVTDFFDDVDIDTILLDSTVFTLVYGDAFIEKVKGKKSKQMTELKVVDPVSMVVNVDEYGREKDYQQKIGGKLSDTILTKEDITHLRFFPKPNSPYGISLIEPSKDTIERKVTTDEAISLSIIKHGLTKYVVTVGSEDEVPPDSVFESIKNKLEDLSNTSEIIVPGPVKIDTIDETGIAGVEEYFNYFQTQLVIGLLCPEEALGLGRGSTEATSKVKEIMYERMIKALQHKMAKKVTRDIIRPFLEERGFDPKEVKMVFNSVTDADEAVKAKWVGNILRSGINPFTTNELRAMFGYSPVDGGDEWKSPEEGDQEGGKTPEQSSEQSRMKDIRIRDLEHNLDDIKEYIEELRNKYGD